MRRMAPYPVVFQILADTPEEMEQHLERRLIWVNIAEY